MALADPFVNIPSGTRPATFETDSENYHNVQLPAKIQEIAAAALAMSLNSVIGTSTTSMLIGTGAKTLTTQTGKSFLAGMDIRVVDVAAPTTNYVNAVVTSYVSGTGVIQFTVPAAQAFGAGTLSNWSIFQTPAGGATQAFVQQLVQNESATSFTTTGTATAYIGTPSPAISALTDKQLWNVEFNVTAGASPTLAVSGTAAKSIKKYNNLGALIAVGATDIIANMISDVEYSLSDDCYILLDPLPPSSATYSTSQNTTSGTSIDFTGIPSWARRVTVLLNGVSTNGTSAPQVQLGSTTIQTTGYISASGFLGNTNTTAWNSSTTGFHVATWNAASEGRGTITLTLFGGNTWICSGVVGNVSGGATHIVGGTVTLAGALDRLRLTTFNGTDAFDAGSVNIMWE